MKKFAAGTIALLSLLISTVLVYTFATEPSSILSPTYAGKHFGIYLHIFAAAVALFLGPFQFSGRIRRQFPRFHRWAGRLYLGVGVLVGGLAGLYMSTNARGGMTGRIGFAGIALVWLYTGLQAYTSIRRGAVSEHRQWMVRNFSVTFAAVTLRIYIPLAGAFGIGFDDSYPVIAWISWVPNLVIAEWWLRRKRVAPVAMPMAESRAS